MGCMGQNFIFCLIELKFRFWLHKNVDTHHESFSSKNRSRSNKIFIAKTPSTNLYEMNSIYTFIDLFIHNKCINVFLLSGKHPRTWFRVRSGAPSHREVYHITCIMSGSTVTQCNESQEWTSAIEIFAFPLLFNNAVTNGAQNDDICDDATINVTFSRKYIGQRQR